MRPRLRGIGCGCLLASAMALLFPACGHAGAASTALPSSVRTSTPSPTPSVPPSPSPFPNGRYDATVTRQEELARGFTNSEFDRAFGSPNGPVPVVYVFQDGAYQFIVEANGVRQVGAAGTYTATKKLLMVRDTGSFYVVTYRWSFDGRVLSLHVLSDTAGKADLRDVRMVTERDYVKEA